MSMWEIRDGTAEYKSETYILKGFEFYTNRWFLTHKVLNELVIELDKRFNSKYKIITQCNFKTGAPNYLQWINQVLTRLYHAS